MSDWKYKNFNEDFSLKNKTAVITGAANGIGIEIAKMFARKGADIVSFDMKRSLELEEYVIAQGRKVLSVTGDITRQADIDALVNETIQTFKKIDILVNCAGVGFLEMAAESTDKVWDLTMAVNLTGTTNMSLAVGKTMIENKEGCIINIASQAGVVALERHLAYGTSKAGVIQMTKQLALEWGQYNVRINAISPTIILTQMGEMNWNNEKGEAFKKSIPSRRFGYPEEVAACAVYLASDAASLFNGANLVLDGGYTIT
ncbi:GolD/DthD family dehydrogenase [Faecalicatena contorta]|uniref:NAD(P)-dependent dehydrogenase, short-chain alcohol dehydrogenase family n=1 Tax=Faecalicatena contorta TaxID=39482 RepID=A0A315ZXW8_9FIRM|nr:D-threitol dehydrogenase [Faecalicatena contorta]PWJ50516.1 NAD(P)-dependent dehydrogenase (short-subunit alcohol dehydrogenase family) [Faecalicatena contorta]SUQ13924.1 NAD(P)-dependent dehydrogenase, short-chain alcohol dehydrogenase family [Faecalicatena contorta]